MATRKATMASKTKAVELDVDVVETSYKPKEREIKAFKIGTKQPDWFKEAVGNELNTFLPPISDPLHYDTEINEDLVVVMPSLELFKAGSWLVKDVDGIHGYSDEDFNELFEEA